MDSIAKRARTLRIERGLTLKEAATQSGITKSHLWDFEMGRSCNPTLKMLNGLADTYGVSLSYLVSGEDITALSRALAWCGAHPDFAPDAKYGAGFDATCRQHLDNEFTPGSGFVWCTSN